MRMLAWLVALMSVPSMASAAPPEVEAAYDQGTVDIENGSKVPYRIHRPVVAEGSGPIPLVVFLHGAGERGDDNSMQLRHFPDRWVREGHLGKRHPAVVLAFQCPQEQWWSAVRKNQDDEWVSDPDGILTPQLQAVMAKVQELAADPAIDDRRIYLTGLSMGGFGSWDLLEHHPEVFAAAVPICGGGNAVAAKAIVAGRTPIWNVHGDADNVVLVERSRDMVKAIRAEGGRVGHTELPGVGHNSWAWAYGPGGVVEWMFSQRRTDEPRFEGS